MSKLELDLFEKFRRILPGKIDNRIIWNMINVCQERYDSFDEDISELLEDKMFIAFEPQESMVRIFNVESPPHQMAWGFDSISGELVET